MLLPSAPDLDVNICGLRIKYYNILATAPFTIRRFCSFLAIVSIS
jgi:hypothetical protein